MDQALYLLWRVNLRNLVKNKLYISRDWHIAPSEIDRLVYFEYEQMLEDINEFNKEQEKKSKEEREQYDNMMSKSKMNTNFNSMYKNAQSSLPKVSIPKL